MSQNEISRSEAAKILYSLFMRLYDVPPVSVEIDNVMEVISDSAEEKEGNTAIVAAGLLAALAIGGGFYFFKKKKSDGKI